MRPGREVDARPPRLGEWILRRTLPAGVVGESIKGDLDQEFRMRRAASGAPAPHAWYLTEALKLGARYGVRRLIHSRRPPAGTSPGMGWGELVAQDVTQGLRRLLRTPGLALFAVVAMGLGIGATATTFSVSHGLLRDLPYAEADRLVHVGWTRVEAGDDKIFLTAAELSALREAQTTLEALSAVRVQSVDLAGSDGPPERISAAQVTPDAFATLGIAPVLGRGFHPEEGAPGGPDVAMLSHGLWVRRYGGDPAVVGRTVRIDGTERTVVGIMPEGFRFPELQELWTPLQVGPPGDAPGEGPRAYGAVGRLREGVSMEEARAEFETLARRLVLAHPEAYREYVPRVTRYYEYFVGRDAVIVMNTLVVIASFVLLIACASVANLLLSRAVARSRELAVRSALGASRARIMGQLLAESLMISLLGGVLGALLAWGGAALFHSAVADLLPFYWMSCAIDGSVLLFVGALVLVAGVLAGMAPALRVSRVGAGEALRDGDRGASSLRIGRLSRGLVVAEVTLSFGLLATAGMMATSPLIHSRQDPGFDGARVLTAELVLRQDAYPEPEDRDHFFQELIRRLESVPEVEAATLSHHVPGVPAGPSRFHLQGQTYERNVDLPRARLSGVTPRYFHVLDTQPLEGRLFDEGDVAGGDPVAIVNRSFAQRFFPGVSPLGRQILTGGLDAEGPWATIVGVVPDLGMNGRRTELPEGILFPLTQRPQRSVVLLLRASTDPLALTPLVRSTLAELDPDLPLSRVRTAQAAMADDTRPELVFVSLVLACGSIALALAAVGLFGVLAFSVRRRTREIGIRLALGAAVRSVLWETLRRGMTQVALGMAVGVLLALGLAPLMRGMFFADRLVDWRVYGVVGALMLGTGFLASVLPAAQAVAVSPLEALRQD